VADAALFLLQKTDFAGHINVGTGSSVSISELACEVQNVVGHRGSIEWDQSKPDGFPEKTMQVGKLSSMGWRPKVTLREGILQTYEWFISSR
jgi:GDP-L-fucose synthase